MSEYNKLLEELEQLSKSEADNPDEKMDKCDGTDGCSPDKKIKKAAEVDEDDNSADETDMDDDEGDDDADDAGELSKSLDATLADGSKGKVIDVQVLMKSINDSRESDKAELAKSLTAIQEQLAEQGKVIKAIGEQVVRMGNAGSGRKSVIKQPLAKSEIQPSNPGELLAKCERAMYEGRLSGYELSVAETYVNRGLAVPQEIINKLK